ncbi:MAG: alpha/beta hydrolase-fold protein [Eubacteriales bacterium]|nr:alpha/beta hydrolase-fold protein [Eubacteriales bacterium]
MIHIWDTKIPQLTGNEIRKTYIYLPDSYETEEDQYYPVLYMFDGHNLFFDSVATYGKSWGLKEYMDYTETQLIIVATECNHNPDHGRLKEYSPYSFMAPDIGMIYGKGHIYMDWLVNELKPAIDKSFRTIPDREYTMIAGSSMGGLMSLFAITTYNHVFSKAACLSPSIWFNTSKLKRMINRAKMAPDTVIYMDYGSEEMANHHNMRSRFAHTVCDLILQGVNVQSRVIPYGEHSEASWERQIPFFMETLLYGIYPEEEFLEDIEKYHEDIKSSDSFDEDE